MNNLMKIVDNTPKTLDKQLFGEFMKKVPVWDYANISRENYQSLSYDDKEKIIRRYYFNMKAQSGGKFESVYCLFCLLDKLY